MDINMTIAIASDHAGYKMKEMIKKFLEKNEYKVLDLGTNSEESVDYPDFAQKLAKKILEKKADQGILICGTGIGMSIAANRFKGIRAALCHHSQIARLSRQHDDANVLCLGERMIGDEVAKECTKTFLNTKFEGGRHTRRVSKIDGIK
jgi:ribose 5-phosphate isomerase B